MKPARVGRQREPSVEEYFSAEETSVFGSYKMPSAIVLLFQHYLEAKQA